MGEAKRKVWSIAYLGELLLFSLTYVPDAAAWEINETGDLTIIEFPIDTFTTTITETYPNRLSD